MRMTGFFMVPALLIVGLCAGCEPMGQGPVTSDAVQTERLVDIGALPSEFGHLIDVTTTPGYREDFAQLWFENEEEGTIRIVYYHFRDRALDPRVDVIRRDARPQPAVEDTP